MKKKLLLLSALVLSLNLNTQAQTSTNVPSFLNSVEYYFTSFNTNFTWTNCIVEASSGYKQVTGANAASFVDAQINVYGSFNLDASIQFSGVGSAINGGEFGVGYAYRHYDTELTAELLGGYDNTKVTRSGNGSFEIEPALILKKKMTLNTYSEIGISEPIFTSGRFNSQPTFRIGAGFTF